MHTEPSTAYSFMTEENTLLFSEEQLASLVQDRIPEHIAIIMDGNRRWAQRHGLPSVIGHWRGADTLTHIVRAAVALGIKILTVYAFSKENWQRSKEEIDALMHLYKTYLELQRGPMIREGVRLRTIGDLSALPLPVARELDISKSLTKECHKIDLVMAFNYSGRDDIRRAFMHMMEDVENGLITKQAVTEALIGEYLDTAQYPDPDLLIRTSGEMRQSNFLLWQVSYSEFYHTDVLWPDFDEKEFLKAIQAYQKRERRFGG